jgi:subtilase family serine protease
MMKYLNAGLMLVLLAGCAGTQNAGSAIPSVAVATNRIAPLAENASSRGTAVIASVPSLSAVGAHDLGRSPSNATLRIAVTLRYRNEERLEKLVASQSDAGSADYHHWLTSAQFNERFSPLAADYARAIASMERSGIRVTKTYANRSVIDATGTVGSIERYFDTSIHRVRQRGAGVRYANVVPAHAPPGLSSLLLTVDGLDTLSLLHTASSIANTKSTKLFGPTSTATGNQGYGPLAFSKAYDFPVVHGYDGLGRSSGVVIDADYADTDLTAFLTYF